MALPEGRSESNLKGRTRENEDVGGQRWLCWDQGAAHPAKTQAQICPIHESSGSEKGEQRDAKSFWGDAAPL